MDTKELIIEKLKKSFKAFGDELYKENYHIENVIMDNDEISITYYVPSYSDIFYTLYMKKQTRDYSGIPKIKDAAELAKTDNPYLLIEEGGNIRKFSDRQYLLSKIYENIKDIKYDDIAFYEKYGMLIYNPLDLDGLYNINMKAFIKEG